MQKLLTVMLSIMLIWMISCSDEEALTSKEKEVQTKSTTQGSVLLINNSIIYRLEPSALWTTSLNQLQVLTKFTITPQTIIFLDGTRVGLNQLRPSYRVRVEYFEENQCYAPLRCLTAVRVFAFSR